MLLQFLADNVDYADYMKGLDSLSYDQLVILVERVIQKIKKQQKNTDTVKEIIEKHFPIKSDTGEYSEKSHCIIECCLHCGSVAIKKHGTTRAGIQRYICKDCGKSFSANYGLITHYSHLSDWQWREIIRGTVEGLSLTDIAKNINVSVSTAWSCRLKVYQTLKNIYGYCDTFNNIVEADGTYVRVSFKGKKDKNFFIDTLGRLSRHHMSKTQRHEYLEKSDKYEELFQSNPELLKELLLSSQKKMTGLDKIDKNHQQVCILTAIDRVGNIYIEPTSAGTADSTDVYTKFTGKIEKDAILVTDEHNSYKYYVRKEQINHVIIESGKYVNSAFSLSRVDSLHKAIKGFLAVKEGYAPATKYLDLYLMFFWWSQKNKDNSYMTMSSKLYDTMTGKVSYSERAKMAKVRIKDLVNRELPIDTKGYYPKVA